MVNMEMRDPDPLQGRLVAELQEDSKRCLGLQSGLPQLQRAASPEVTSPPGSLNLLTG